MGLPRPNSDNTEDSPSGRGGNIENDRGDEGGIALLEQSAGWEDRISALERDNQELNKAVADLKKQVRQRELDTAYMYIHSNWLWIRWALGRDQDRSAEDSELYRRARAAELAIRDSLTRNLRTVQFDPQPMEVAFRWRIETTVTLNQHRYTFFD